MLNVRELTKSFEGLNVVSGLTFDLDDGEILGLIGPNGAGKATVFNLLSGILKPDSGAIFMDNENIAGRPPHRITGGGMTRTFRTPRLIKGVTALENLKPAFYLIERYSWFDSLLQTPRYRRAEAEMLAKISETLDLLGIGWCADVAVEDLAFAVQKKLELARALLCDPKILLLDGPSSGLNPAEADEITDLIRRIRGRSHIGIIVIEHNMRVVMGVSDRIVVMSRGSLIAQGSPAEIRGNEKVISAYLGEKTLRQLTAEPDFLEA